MDSTLPDAFEASQFESSAGQGFGAGAVGIESMGSTNSFARGPYVKVDGMLVLRLALATLWKMASDAFFYRSPKIRTGVIHCKLYWYVGITLIPLPFFFCKQLTSLR